jgi:hypothetical protein
VRLQIADVPARSVTGLINSLQAVDCLIAYLLDVKDRLIRCDLSLLHSRIDLPKKGIEVIRNGAKRSLFVRYRLRVMREDILNSGYSQGNRCADPEGSWASKHASRPQPPNYPAGS